MLLYCEKADNKEDIFISSLFTKIVTIFSEKYLSMKNYFPFAAFLCICILIKVSDRLIAEDTMSPLGFLSPVLVH